MDKQLQVADYRELLGHNNGTKWSWACRKIDQASFHLSQAGKKERPEVGDLALLRVSRIGFHSAITLTDNRKVRLYPDDLIVGVFGNRYATDAYEAEVRGTEGLSLLTAGGMVGTILSKSDSIQRPTEVEFVGYLDDTSGRRANLKEIMLRPPIMTGEAANLVVVVGTGMSTGKTTVMRKLIKGLSTAGMRVAALKLTGSVSPRDQDELKSADARLVLDFSDYGFPSTYLAPKQELMALLNLMLTDASAFDPNIVVMEIADGILERETAFLLAEPFFRSRVRALVLSADSSLSGLYATKLLEEMGYNVSLVSGKMTSAPLYVKEFKSKSDIPVVSSAGSGDQLAQVVSSELDRNTSPVEVNAGYALRGEAFPDGSQ